MIEVKRLMYALATCAVIFPGKPRAIEVGLGTGLGDQFGVLGTSLHLQHDQFYASVGKHLFHSGFSISSGYEFLSLGQKHNFTVVATYGRSYENIVEEMRNRICLGVLDSHDFGRPSGFKAYYGFQVMRYFYDAKDFAILIPIVGISYSYSFDPN
jgi:hypothetical protein